MSENSDRNDFNTNLGDQIKGAVQEALESGDFKKVNVLLSGTVNGAIEEAKRQINNASRTGTWNNGSAGQNDHYGNPGWNNGTANGNGTWNNGSANRNGSWQQWQKTTSRTSTSYKSVNLNTGRDTFHYKEAQYQNPGQRQTASWNKGSAGNGKQVTIKTNTAYATAPGQTTLPAVRTKRVGHVSGILYQVFGGIGTGVMGAGLLVELLMLLVVPVSEMIVPFGIVSALLAGSVWMIERGCVKRQRVKRAERYAALCGNKTYIDIEELAMHTGKSTRFVLKDVKKMLKLGIFPEGHLDREEKCLILDDVTYRQYLTLEKEKKALELEEKVSRMQKKQAAGEITGQAGKAGADAGQRNADSEKTYGKSVEETKPETDNPELNALIAEGQESMKKLRKLNELIEGEEVSKKLDRLDDLLGEIFDRVKEHPEQMPQLRKFMEYYLPTTIKLVEAYEEFDNVSTPGNDILTAKAEIEKTLDTINEAFVQLLNKLFQASAFDATADAQVLQTMLAKEGLTKNAPFEEAGQEE